MERIKDRTRRAYGRARSHLRTVVADTIPSSLYRFTGSRSQATVGDRLRDAVYRDRGLHAAQVHAATPAAEPGNGTGAEPPVRGAGAEPPPIDEPICTRTMARLLARQGCTERALRVYEVLVQKTADPELRREAEALRAASAPA